MRLPTPGAWRQPAAIKQVWSLVGVALVSLSAVYAELVCEHFTKDMKASDPRCQTGFGSQHTTHYHNLPLLTDVYCFNNGTGICKVLAGQFEFYMNSWTQKFLGPIESSKHVDKFGLHRRVPVSYTPDGQVIHADRAINWARYFVAGDRGEYNIMMATSFNWCIFAPAGNWPYKSSFVDHDGVTQIFFFNKQTCIYNPATKQLQHYNTRFYSISRLRLDYDYNPAVWSAELENHKVVLFFHLRQHFLTRTWTLKKNFKPNLDFFIEFGKTNRSETPLLDGQGPFIRERFYRNHSDLCIDDYFAVLNDAGNAQLCPGECGFEQRRTAVYGLGGPRKKPFLIELDVHSIPQIPKECQFFFGLETDTHWEEANYRGLTFSATTAYPLDGTHNSYMVISLYSTYSDPPKEHDYDENYPRVHFDTYVTDFNNGLWDKAQNRKPREETVVNHLNYVDDFEYLPICKTVLVIFGPLYSEFPVDKFNAKTIANLTAPMGSIYDLGLNELVLTFFAYKDEIYFYHRTNFVARHQYKCGANGALVTAKKTGAYMSRFGPHHYQLFDSFQYRKQPPVDYREENLFKDLNILKGELAAPDAPDATQFEWKQDDLAAAPRKSVPWWIWLIVLIGLFLLAAMVILGLVSFRKRLRRRRVLEKTRRSEMASIMGSSIKSQRSARSRLDSNASQASQLGAQATARSALPIFANKSQSRGQRAGLASAMGSAVPSRRSSLTSRHSSTNKSPRRPTKR